MMLRDAPPPFPQALDDDDDDVAWNLRTADAQWRRGARADALEWLARAVDTAIDAGRIERARDLQQHLNALNAALKAGWAPEPPTRGGVEAGGATAAGPPSGEEELEVDIDIDVDLEIEPAGEALEVLEETLEVLEPEILDPEDPSEVDMDTLETLPPQAAFGAARAQPLDSVIDAGDLIEPLSDEPAMRARSDTLLDSVPAPPTESEPPPLPATEPLDEPARALASVPASAAHSTDALAPEAEAPRASEPSTLDSVPPTESEPLPQLGAEAENRLVAPSDAPTIPPGAPRSAEREAEAEPQPPSAPSAPAAESVLGFSLRAIAGLEELPESIEADLVRTVELQMLDESEEATGFGLAIVLEGTVAVMPAITDVVCGRAAQQELVVAEGHLTENMALKVVAENGPARVATWTSEDVSRLLATCPATLAEDLCTRGDRLQAIAGASMGPLGEQLDEALRGMVLDRCVTRVLDAGEVVAEAGKPLPGMVLVGAGRLELTAPATPDAAEDELAPGDFLFPGELMRAAPAPLAARAGRSGALILFCDRRTAHELLVSVPPLLEILS
ncbi:MAG TPA: hypothetical protein VKY73_15025 [Polyangiaceae bacterium]|nr:hypothetical protein [Polyangiaceae bacterium]